jgi:hypothetical protein
LAQPKKPLAQPKKPLRETFWHSRFAFFRTVNNNKTYTKLTTCQQTVLLTTKTPTKRTNHWQTIKTQVTKPTQNWQPVKNLFFLQQNLQPNR